jgi:hypothetical protein
MSLVAEGGDSSPQGSLPLLSQWIRAGSGSIGRGGVAERLMAVVLKTTVPKGTAGSNPVPSANPDDLSLALDPGSG